MDHPAALAAAGLDKPKRKRGRPPKKTKANLEKAQEALRQQELLKAETMEEPSGKRRRKTPTRFKEAVQVCSSVDSSLNYHKTFNFVT